jgi:hypothetical protein
MSGKFFKSGVLPDVVQSCVRPSVNRIGWIIDSIE